MSPFPNLSIWRNLIRDSSALLTPLKQVNTTKQDIISCRITAFYRSYGTVHNESKLWPADLSTSRLELKSHPLGWEAIQKRVEPYFVQNWDFEHDHERKGLMKIGLSRAFDVFFPLVLDDRVDATGRLHYLILLIDDQMVKMNASEMLQYRDRVMDIARGNVSPNREICLEWMLYDTLDSMRKIDESLTSDVVEGFCALIQGQTAEHRLTVKHLGPYLEFREIDVGRPLRFYTALIRFGANLNLTAVELEQTAILESHASRFFGIFNDVYSWDREWKNHCENKTDGSYPFSAVFTLAQETGLSYPACQRMMLVYCRELEIAFKQASEDLRNKTDGTLRPEMVKYIKGLEYFMSGVESWTKWSPRYRI